MKRSLRKSLVLGGDIVESLLRGGGGNKWERRHGWLESIYADRQSSPDRLINRIFDHLFLNDFHFFLRRGDT